MRKSVLYITTLMLLFSCKKEVQKPVWINANPTINFRFSDLKFKCEEKKWKVFLLTSIQPIELFTEYKNGILSAKAPIKGGIIEGAAQIQLVCKDDNFFYSTHLINEKAKVSSIEYRSPKTVNPDSSLHQQLINFSIDEYRNIKTDKYKHLFYEHQIYLSPKAGVFQSAIHKPLLSFYVQPGSCVAIPLKVVFNENENIFEVTAGPLKDEYENIVADGTSVAFIYQNTQVARMEVALLNGFAIARIPASAYNYKIYAQVHEVKSNTLMIKP